MNQETLTQANDNDEMEIDLLEVFYYLKARAIWLFVAFMVGAIGGRLYRFLHCTEV